MEQNGENHDGRTDRLRILFVGLVLVTEVRADDVGGTDRCFLGKNWKSCDGIMGMWGVYILVLNVIRNDIVLQRIHINTTHLSPSQASNLVIKFHTNNTTFLHRSIGNII